MGVKTRCQEIGPEAILSKKLSLKKIRLVLDSLTAKRSLNFDWFCYDLNGVSISQYQ